jgi:hypothetical protein
MEGSLKFDVSAPDENILKSGMTQTRAWLRWCNVIVVSNVRRCGDEVYPKVLCLAHNFVSWFQLRLA